MEVKKKLSLKTTVIVISAVLLTVVLAFVLFFLLITSSDRDATFRDPDLSFAEPDYETDILSDHFYTRYNRDVMYTEYGTGESLNQTNSSSMGSYGTLFYNYFQTVINGDYNAYPTYFTEQYKKNNDLPERFTMQRIYDISVNLFSRETIEYNGETSLCSRFIVSYRIQYNNGTFRGDITGTDMRPLLFSVVEIDGKLYIDSISQINYTGA